MAGTSNEVHLINFDPQNLTNTRSIPFRTIQFLTHQQCMEMYAEYCIVTGDIDMSNLVQSLLDTLLLSYHPQMIISIIGGNNNQETLIQHESICKTIKAINSKLRLLIITNGYHSGLTRSVAEGFSTAEPNQNNVTLIGINSLQAIESSDELAYNKQCSDQVYSEYHIHDDILGNHYLDPCHDCFILFEDGDVLQLRIQLQQALQNSFHHIPVSSTPLKSQKIQCHDTISVVSLLIGGNMLDLKLSLDTILREDFLFIVCGSGGAADLLYELVSFKEALTRENIENAVLRYFSFTVQSDMDHITAYQTYLIDAIDRKDLIQVIRTTKIRDFSDDIYQVLLCNYKTQTQRYKMQFLWGKIDEVTLSLDICNMVSNTDLPKFSIHYLIRCAYMKGLTTVIYALVRTGKLSYRDALEGAILSVLFDGAKQTLQVIDFLLEKGTFKIYHFVTVNKLKDLYWEIHLSDIGQKISTIMGFGYINPYHLDETEETRKQKSSCCCRKFASRNSNEYENWTSQSIFAIRELFLWSLWTSHLELSYHFWKQLAHPIIAGLVAYKILSYRVEVEKHAVMKQKCGKYASRNSNEDENWTSQSIFAIRELFLWSLWISHLELSYHFWKQLAHPIIAGLVAYKILSYRAEVEKHAVMKQKCGKYARWYKSAAFEMIQDLSQEDHLACSYHLLKDSPEWGQMSCFSIIMLLPHFNDFIGLDSYIRALKSVWNGVLGEELKVRQIFMSTMSPLASLWRNSSSLKNSNHPSIRDAEEATMSRKQGKHHKHIRSSKKQLEKYYVTPRLKYFIHATFYLAFLVSYAIFITISFRDLPTLVEQVIIAWVFSMTIEEIIQSLTTKLTLVSYLYNCTSLTTQITRWHGRYFMEKFFFWITNFWNIMNTSAICIFYLALVFRMIEFTIEVGRILYAVDFIIFCLRCLQFISPSINHGPKLIMIRKLCGDLMSFLVLLLVFLIAFGVATQAILYPNQLSIRKAMTNILVVPYLRVFGETLVDESEKIIVCPLELNNTAVASVSHGYSHYNCISVEVITNILLVIYLLIAVVLLFNLLIAILNKSYDQLESETKAIWAKQFSELVHDFIFRSALAPPMNLIRLVLFICRSFYNGQIYYPWYKNDSEKYTDYLKYHAQHYDGIQWEAEEAYKTVKIHYFNKEV
ncbi:Transient receptor potential cation channel subfamily M member 1 [Trichoplax sp. H2]|nr:Transient receptor potential cation channel subfamily M member 1 [Trichoplax sp. H2]|eukprot:RDD42201.1 Transient receptor potential cation channel subfamily M member 1 [Trichoplax sp. H2]